MAEQVITHPVSFDSAEHPFYADIGIPFRVRMPVDDIDLPVSLHLAGVYQYKVVNARLNRMASPSDEELSGELLGALTDTLAGREDLFGLPEQLLLRGGTLRFAIEQRLSDDWREHWGVALESLVFTDCRMFPADREKLDRMLRGELPPQETQETELPPLPVAPSPNGRKLTPSQEAMNKALEELNARRRAQTESWKK